MTPPVSTTSGSHRRIRSGLSIGAAAALLVTLVPAASADDVDAATTSATQSSEELSSPTGAYFIEFEPQPATRGGSTAQVQRAQRSFVAEAESAGVDLEVRHEFSTLWSGVSADLDDDAAELVADLPQVKAIYPVLPVEAPEGPVSEPELLSALSMTGADIAQSELGFDGEGIRVGIIDTGVDYDHPDFGGTGVDGGIDFADSDKVVAGFDFVGDDYNADPGSPSYQPVPMPDNDPDDCQGHGTHVAGIVGADGDVTNGGVRGVAPAVELGAYRVFGCEGSTESDIMVAAMERALADGMDVVNQSIGSAFSTWPQYPTAVASDNLVDAGVVMVASIGNSGASGTWSAGAPGVGEDVIGVASFDNVAVTAAVVEIDGEEVAYMPGAGSPEPPTEGSLPLARLGDPGTPAARGCPNISTDLTGQAVLIERGADPSGTACDATFYGKAFRAQQAGAAAVVIYNNAPGMLSPSIAGDPPVTIPVIGISMEAGLAADAAVLDGGATLTWTDIVGTMPNPTGGIISSFSSYGLAADLTLKPDLGAPGGSIYSTYPLESGEYATLSGTSMSAPHVAGAVALLLEARPDTAAHDVRDLLLNSADPAALNTDPTTALLEPVHRQGAGMLDIDDTIESTATVTPGKLSLGESEQGAVTRTLTVTNSTGADVTYALSSLDAAATAGNPDAPTIIKDASAQVVMPDQLTVPAGGQAEFDVTISPSAPLNLAQYGGYVVLTPEDGEPLSVPFAGFAGDYQALELFGSLANLKLPALGQLAECDRLIGIDCAAGGLWQVPAGQTSYTMAGGDVPTVLIHLEHPAQSLTFSIWRPMPEGQRMQAVEGQAIARVEQHVGRDSNTFSAWTWDGMRSTQGGGRSAVPDGHYILQVEALSPLGDPDNPDHVQTWSTPAFVIDRDGDGVPPLEPEEPVEPGPGPQPPAQQYGFFLNDGWDAQADHVFAYGRFTDEVLIGDWDGDGTDSITVRRGNQFFVSNAPRGGEAERVITYGRPGDVVLVGDWDGNGTDTLAVRRGSAYHVKNSLAGGPADRVIAYGRADDAVMVGDWDGNGTDTLAVRRGSTYYVKNTISGGNADRTFAYGRPADITLAGDWDGNGTDTFAVRRGNQYFVKNSLAGGQADFSVAYGRASDEVFVGDWNGDGTDTLGVRRTP